MSLLWMVREAHAANRGIQFSPDAFQSVPIIYHYLHVDKFSIRIGDIIKNLSAGGVVEDSNKALYDDILSAVYACKMRDKLDQQPLRWISELRPSMRHFVDIENNKSNRFLTFNRGRGRFIIYPDPQFHWSVEFRKLLPDFEGYEPRARFGGTPKYDRGAEYSKPATLAMSQV